MRTRERDYNYLLLHLIPQHRLHPGTRKQITRTVLGQSPEALRRTSLRVLDELCEAEYFVRRSVERENGHVVLTYAKRAGGYAIRIHVPHAEYAGGEPKRVDEVVDAPLAEVTIDILPEVARFLSVDDERESTISRLTELVRSLPGWIQARAARVMLIEERIGEAHSEGPEVAVVPEKTMIKRAIFDRCRRTRQPEHLDGAAAAAVGVATPPAIGPVEDMVVVVAPLYVIEEFWGVVEIWFKKPARTVDARVDAAVGIAGQVLENVMRLRELTSFDKLTGLYNRPFYDRQVRIEIERATRSGSKLTMLVLDIDNFSRLNNTLGHQKGDEGLRLVSDLIRRNLRKIDLAFRYGGEEFVVLLPGTAEVEAIHTAERVRSRIAESERLRDDEDTSLKLTVSIGGAVFPDHARDEEELFAKADAAMFRAKRRGKNRVEFHRDESLDD